MFQFICRRVFASLIIIFLATTFVFLIIHLLPGDPVILLLGEQGAANPEFVDQLRKKLKLDLPLHIQYYEWMKGLSHFDLGNSLQNDVPVIQELVRRIPRSLELIFGGLLISIFVGIPIGVLGAKHPNGLWGWISSTFAVLGFSSPSFVTGIVLIIIFSLSLRFLPSSGYVSFSENAMENLRCAFLPSITLGFGFVGVVIRMTRASLLDIINKDYIRTARAKGLSERGVLYKHALPNALIPVISILGVRAGNLLGGTVIIESLFNWPGLSSLLVKGCFDRDYPMIQGTLLSIFVIFVLISLCVDLCHGLLDPKLRQEY